MNSKSKIKVKELKGLLSVIDKQISNVESFIMEHTVVPIDFDDESFNVISSQVKTALSKLESLLNEKYRIEGVLDSALYKVVMDKEGQKLDYPTLVANKNKLLRKSSFLNKFSNMLWKTNMDLENKTRYLPVMSSYAVVAEQDKIISMLYLIEKQLDEIDNAVELEIDIIPKVTDNGIEEEK